MIQAGSGFRFPAKALQMRVGSPVPEANDLERYCPVETFLPRAINHTLAAATNFLQQFIVAKIGEVFARLDFLLLQVMAHHLRPGSRPRLQEDPRADQDLSQTGRLCRDLPGHRQEPSPRTFDKL